MAQRWRFLPRNYLVRTSTLKIFGDVCSILVVKSNSYVIVYYYADDGGDDRFVRFVYKRMVWSVGRTSSQCHSDDLRLFCREYIVQW